MNIGIDFFEEKNAGGAYQYCLSFLDALKYDSQNQYTIFNRSTHLPSDYRQFFRIIDCGVTAPQHQKNLFIRAGLEYGYRLLLVLKLFVVIDFIYKYFFRHILKSVKQSGVELLIFTGNASYSRYLNLPFIAPIHDLEHRKHAQFPEVSARGRWQSRERYFSYLCQTAKVILVDSEIGKQDVVNFYRVNPHHVAVLPFLPPNYLNEHLSAEQAKFNIKNFNLPERFLFYPAQFWPHKNHLSIVKAVKYLKDRGEIVKVVFTGSKKAEWGEFKRVWNFVETNQLNTQIFYLGYVSNDVMSALYKLAVALIMPTFFGPTNIPVLEAWKMSCPVLYSNIPGCREQLGGAGLLINPADPADIAAKISTIWQADQTFRNNLIGQGHAQLNKWRYPDFSFKIKQIINECKPYGTQNNQTPR